MKENEFVNIVPGLIPTAKLLIMSLLNSHFTTINPSTIENISLNGYNGVIRKPAILFYRFYLHDGWIHSQNGLSFRISNQNIVLVKIEVAKGSFFFDKELLMIPDSLGKSDYILTETNTMDVNGLNKNEIHVFKQHKLYVHKDRHENIVEVSIGELDEREYKKKSSFFNFFG